MEVTPQMFQNILNTLPVSLYAKRDIDVSIDLEGEKTYYNPMEDSIVISYNTMSRCLNKFNYQEELESTIRGLLYHEISHALLTYPKLKEGLSKVNARVINVFEDERIETIFKNLFYGVNFKRNVVLINNWNNNPPKNAFDSFYNTVRFRYGKEKFIKRVDEIINKYQDLDPTLIHTEYYVWSIYKEDVNNLWIDIAKEWYEELEPQKIESIDPNYKFEDTEDQKNTIRKLIELENPEDLTGDHPDVGGAFSNEEDSNEVDHKMPLSSKEIDEILKEIEDKITDCVGSKPQKILESRLNRFIDNTLTAKMEEIFENFLSRNKNNGSAQRRYSGVIDPRAFTRKDWRIFTYKSTEGPIKGYDKLHINLFIDTSGSFRSNDEKVNTILKSLDILEDKYPFFDFDLVTCQVGEILRDKKHRYIESWGGNDLDNKVKEIYDQINPGNRLNYNIILFDGDAFTDSRGHRESHKKNFGVFNSSKCSIISDSSNEKYIKEYAPLANSTFVYGGNSSKKSYSSMLYDNILNAMKRILL